MSLAEDVTNDCHMEGDDLDDFDESDFDSEEILNDFFLALSMQGPRIEYVASI